MKSLSIQKILIVLLAFAAGFMLFAFSASAEDYGSFSYSTVEPENGEDFEPYVAITGYSESDGSTDTVVEIPSDIEDVPVTRICASAFSNKTFLTEVIIPDSVTVIENSAFYQSAALTAVVLPDSVVSIGDSAFQGCSSLQYAEIGNGVKEIGDIAFKDCTALTWLDLGNSVESIGNGAFFGCESLKSVYIPACVQEIGSLAFGMVQNGDVEKAVDGFVFYTDSNDALSAYNEKYSAVAPAADGSDRTAFTIVSKVTPCGDGNHTVDFVPVRSATDAYEGLDMGLCSVCHKLVTRPNTEVTQTISGASEWTTLILGVVVVIAVVIAAALYIRKSKARRAQAIEAYKAGKPVPSLAEKEKAEAKQAEKDAKKRARQEARLRSYGILPEENKE